MILQSLIFAGLIFAGEKHDYNRHDQHKHHPRYDHEWTERHKVLENQERIIRELRKQREEGYDRWRGRNRDSETERGR